MEKYIILLRGINVSGKNKMPMLELRTALENKKFQGVKTYIQSGNIVLMANKPPEPTIDKLIQNQFGFTVGVLALTEKEFMRSYINNPYSNEDGKTVHFYYCKHNANINITKLKKYIAVTESYQLIDNVFYLHAPEGIGRSKLVSNIEICLETVSTGRNMNTINKVYEML